MANFLSVLRELAAARVDFIVVGGVACVLNGAPVNTFDLDIVPDRTDDNLNRLLKVLDRRNAVYRIQPERRIRPGLDHLRSPGHHNLISDAGPLDILGTIGDQLSYGHLLPHTVELDLGDDLRVKVLNLETIIAVKEQLGGEKDRATLPILRQTLKQQQR